MAPALARRRQDTEDPMPPRAEPDLAERRAIVVDILSQAVMALAVEQSG